MDTAAVAAILLGFISALAIKRQNDKKNDEKNNEK